MNSLLNLNTLLCAVTAVLILSGVILLGDYFSTLSILMGLVLLLTYILMVPVNLIQHAVVYCSKLLNRQPPLHRLFSKTPLVNPRILSVFIVYFAFFMLTLVTLLRVLPVLDHEVTGFIRTTGGAINQLISQTIEWSDRRLGHSFTHQIYRHMAVKPDGGKTADKPAQLSAAPPLPSNLSEEKRQIRESLLFNGGHHLAGLAERWVDTIILNLFVLFTQTVKGVTSVLCGLLLLFYLLADGAKLKAALVRVLPKAWQTNVLGLLHTLHEAMFSLVKSQLWLGCLSGAYMFIVYLIFQVPYALLLGLFYVLSELLPVVGTWIAFWAGLVVILVFKPPMTLLWVWLCSHLYQMVKENILIPKIVGEAVGLHPVVMILVILTGIKLAGVLGLVLAFPVSCLVNAAFRYWLASPREPEQHASSLIQA